VQSLSLASGVYQQGQWSEGYLQDMVRSAREERREGWHGEVTVIGMGLAWCKMIMA
jgi:hypothetical protein